MAIRTAPLNLLTFPQSWKKAGRRLSLRYLCFPRIDPDVPLSAGLPTFADASLAFELRIIPSLERLPAATDVETVIGGSAPGSALAFPPSPVDRAEAFEELRTSLGVQARSPWVPGTPRTVRRILKPRTASWRSLVGDGSRGRFLIDEDATACSLHESLGMQPPEPQKLTPDLRWGQAMALALRTEPLARALGLIGDVTVQLPNDVLAEGGWAFFALHLSSDYSADPGLVSLQAARIPALENSRPLYAATLFPVDQTDFIPDDPIAEATNYSNGFAKLVHVAQEFEDDPDPSAGAGDGDCIRLAWDDEQVTEWLNRQSDPVAGTPMGTMGYRVDVRDVTLDGDWHSLQQVSSVGRLKLGDLDLGAWQGERAVELVPLRRDRGGQSEFWLPAFYASWRGSSLVLSDPDLVRLQKAAAPVDPDYPELKAYLLDREKVFAPVGLGAVNLRYGHRYAFRVRLTDLTHGGPGVSAKTPKDPDGVNGYAAEVQFTRRRRPGAVEVVKLPTRDEPWLVIQRPKLRLPELRFAGDALLDSEADAILSGKPDPDVESLSITLEVKALAGDRVDWQPLYGVSRFFPEGQVLLPFSIVDIAQIAHLDAPGPTEPLPIPTGRDLRLRLVANGRANPGYFADEMARAGVTTVVPLKASVRQEEELFTSGAEPLISFFLRAPGHNEDAPRPLDLLAKNLGLSNDELTLMGSGDQRIVLACSGALRQTPSPERHSIQFSSDADLRQRWLNVITFDVRRDWSWLGLADKGLLIERSVSRPEGPQVWAQVGTMTLPTAVAHEDLPSGDDAQDLTRQYTRVRFFDAVSPLAVYGSDHPHEMVVSYRVTPQFADGIVNGSTPLELSTRLPIVTPPRQVPKLVSAGIALSPIEPVDDYSATNERARSLWLEFDSDLEDPGDGYFARVLAVAPDPLLIGVEKAVPPVEEPALPLDAEWMRRIVPGQSEDSAGLSAMPDPLAGGDNRHVLVPLPAGLGPDAPELTGMFTYEIRVGHCDERWSTAHGRWGPPLRISGVQHPPPQLRCEAARSDEIIFVSAPFACPVHGGRSIQPRSPNTRLWALLYARLRQVDDEAYRNLLLLRQEMKRTDAPAFRWANVDGSLKGVAEFPIAAIREELEVRGLPADTPLTALAAEFYIDPIVNEPVGSELGEARLMRASTLVPVPAEC